MMSATRKNGHYGRKIGIGHKIPSPLPLMLISRLLDYCVECADGFDTPCWLWQGYCDADGYGEVKWRGKKFRAARLAYAVFRGELAAGMDVDHLCLTRACINPAHLEATTPGVNRGERRHSRISEGCPI